MKKNSMYVELMREGGKAAVSAYNQSKRIPIATHPNQQIEDRKHRKEKYKIKYENYI